MHVFILSLPFDLENSGDYDYCQVLEKEIAKQEDCKATYLTAKTLNINEDNLNEIRIALDNLKNQVGEQFYSFLQSYYAKELRKQTATQIKNYIKSDDSVKKILNIQLRPPETGFIFDYQDLEELKEANIKLCVTCHEYKLNYSRRCLQTMMHLYFSASDLVIFFNEKDLKNAHKHATREIFLDDIHSSVCVERAPDKKILSRGFISKDLQISFKSTANNKATLFVKDQKFAEISCAYLIGSLKAEKGRFEVQEFSRKMVCNGPLNLDWGMREGFKMKKKPDNDNFTVSGLIVETPVTPEISALFAKSRSSSSFIYNFDHQSYNLRERSFLSRVPPTTAVVTFDVQKALDKPPNIIVFGLIRLNKGFEEAVEVIKEVFQRKLPSRLIIAGKPSSLNLLQSLINAKFGCDIICEDDLEMLENLELTSEDLVKLMLDKKIRHLKSESEKTSYYIEGFEGLIHSKRLEHDQKKRLSYVASQFIKNPSPLQEFIWKAENVIADCLPIDFFFDLSPEELNSLFQYAKYAIKFDEKGWANNASAMINALAYQSVLYTSWGMCTSHEISKWNAMVLTKRKYALKDDEHLTREEEDIGKRTVFKSTKRHSSEERKMLFSAKIIVDDIQAREENQNRNEILDEIICQDQSLRSNRDNRETLSKAQELITKEFNPSQIVKEMVQRFQGCFSN